MLKRGDEVEFTHPGHGVIRGTVKSVNPKTVTVENTSDGRRGWRVTLGMLRPAGSGSGSAPSSTTAATTTYVATPAFSPGDAVEIMLPNPWTGAASTLGVVTRVSRVSSGTLVEVYAGGRSLAYDRSQLSARPRRPEAEVVREIHGVYNMLSPENLYADGLRSRSAAQHLASALNRALRALFVEAGRRVSEEEAYAEYDRERAAGRP